MRKKILSVMLSITMMAGLVACGGGSQAPATTAAASGTTAAEAAADSGAAEGSEAPAEAAGDYKIGIMTTTVSQSEESYRAAEMLQEQHPDTVVLATFPDKFATEQETTISTALSLASDPDVKAIIFSQAVQGTAAACQKIREVRPDILLIAAGYQDDSATTSSNCDVFYHSNVPKMGFQMVDELSDMGAKTFVHYSFPRHLAWQPTADRLQNMKDRCAELGLTLVETTTPDPMSDAGTSGTQQFVLEDVPRAVDQYGTETAFFGTNTSQQEPMIKCVVNTKSYFTMPSDPSPFVGFPSALGIEVPADKLYDSDYMMNAISEKLAEADMTGHMGTWTAPLMTLFMTGSYAYAEAFCEGKTNGEKLDAEVFKQTMSEAAGGEVDVENITDGGTTYDNGFFIMCSYERF